MIYPRVVGALVVALTAVLAVGPLAMCAYGEEVSDPVEWRLEQPLPPELPSGQRSSTPVGLGKIADIEFSAPNRGVLITAGSPPTIPAGVWIYNGRGWRELADVCGATDGRIAWAGSGSDEFWTVSDGRPGTVSNEHGLPPLEDNTLCHFAKGSSAAGEVVGSYAAPPFQSNSYTKIHAAGCLNAEDCWFAGEPLPHIGAFHLRWNGHTLTEEPNPQGRAVESMSPFEGDLYEGVRIRPPEALRAGETREEEEQLTPSETGQSPAALHQILPTGQTSISGTPFASLEPGVPIYGEEEPAYALEALQLSADGESLWGAANPLLRRKFPAGSELASGEVTIVRDVGGVWSQILGTTSDPPEGNPFTKFTAQHGEPTPSELQREEREDLDVTSIAPEPDSEGAWVSLRPAEKTGEPSLEHATVARISAGGTVSDERTLPTIGEPTGGLGSAEKITCPAVNDCWMVTSAGWLFHLAPADERQLPADTETAFTKLITVRPPDQGVPQVVPDAPPAETGLLGEQTAAPPLVTAVVQNQAKVPVPLLSRLHSRLRHGHTLELSFHLAVKARLRLIAMRKKAVVASTKNTTLASGNRKLLLALNPRRWPTKLDLQTHALAPLPLTTTRSAGVNTVSTSLVFPRTRELLGSTPFPELLP